MIVPNIQHLYRSLPHDGLISSGNETVLNFVGEITVAAPREAVFKALSDAPFFASCIEGVRDLTAIDATHYDAVLETRIAYMRFNFKVGVQLSRVTPSEEIEAKVEGTPIGMVGRLTATATTRLERQLLPLRSRGIAASTPRSGRLCSPRTSAGCLMATKPSP